MDMKFPEFMKVYQMFMRYMKADDDMYEKEYEDGMFDDFSKQEMDEMYNQVTHAGKAYDEDDSKSMQIVKQFDEEEMVAIEPLYINVGEADAHGDGITDKALDDMIDNFNKNIKNIKGNIHHQYMTDGFYPVKAYRMPMTVYVGDPKKPSEMTKIEEGQPVVKVQFTRTELGKQLWEKRKEGILRGVSIGATGKRVENPDYMGDM